MSRLLMFQVYQTVELKCRPNYRSKRPEVLCKKAVLKNFAKFAGKYLCQSLFFSKIASLKPATLFKKRL